MDDEADEITVVIPGCSSLQEQTRKALSDVLERHGREVLEEAGRLEAAVHTGPGQPMITDSMINDVDLWKRRGYIRPKLSMRRKAALLVGFAATYFGGLSSNNITEPLGAIGFALCALVGFGAMAWGWEHNA